MAYHVVIADDDKINLKAAELILSFNGYKVSCVSGADELMTALDNNDVDLVMIDSQMSGNNGFEITKQLSSSEKGKNVPFVLMVASTDSATVTKATKSGAIDIVVKPFVTSVMLLRVKILSSILSSRTMLPSFLTRRRRRSLKRMNVSKGSRFRSCRHLRER